VPKFWRQTETKDFMDTIAKLFRSFKYKIKTLFGPLFDSNKRKRPNYKRIVTVSVLALAIIITAIVSLFNFSREESQASFVPLSPGEYLPGAYIIDMDHVVTNEENSLKPYGLVYDLVENDGITVDWIIKPNKTSFNDVDLQVDGKEYRSGVFIIPEDVIPIALPTIQEWQAKGVVVDGPIHQRFSADVYDSISSMPNMVIDVQNSAIAESYFASAEIPASAYSVGLSTDVDSCDDLYIMSDVDPIWATHNNLSNFNAQGGFIWASCNGASELENSINPADPSQRLNFLTTDGLLNQNSHVDGTPAYTNSNFSDSIMQIQNPLDYATTNGSQQIYLPKPGSNWRGTTTTSVLDSDHPDIIAGNSPGPASVLSYGPGFGQSGNGLVMYEAGRDHNSGPSSDYFAAQRAFFNFMLESAKSNRVEQSFEVQVPTGIQSGQSLQVQTNVSNPSLYSFDWTDTCGGSFSDSTSATPTYTAPGVSNGLDCVITATITTTDGCSRSNSDTQGLRVYNGLSDIEVAIAVDDPQPVPGQIITISTTITNNGGDGASNVEIVIPLPGTLSFNGETASSGSYDPFTETWTIPAIANGGNTSLEISAMVDSGALGQQISVDPELINSDQQDSNPGNNSSSISLEVGFADIAITKGVNNSTPKHGDTLIWEVSVTNNGPSTATDVIIQDDLPAGVTLQSSNSNIGSFTPGNGLWSISELESGKSALLVIKTLVSTDTVVYPFGTSLTNTATIQSSSSFDPEGNNNSGTATATITQPNPFLTVQKNSATTKAVRGNTITYSLDTWNQAPTNPEVAGVIQTDVVIRDQIPQSTTYDVGSATANGVFDTGNNEVVWNLGSNTASVDGNFSNQVVGTPIDVSFGAQYDTYIRENAPNTNYGTETTMRVRQNPSGDYHSLVSFDFSSIPSGSNILNAELSLYVTTTQGGVADVEVYKSDQEYTGTTATWNNFTTGSPWNTPGGDFSGPLLGTFDGTVVGRQEVDVATVVQSVVDGNIGSHGFILVPSSANTAVDSVRFGTQNTFGFFAPQLNITYDTSSGFTTTTALDITNALMDVNGQQTPVGGSVLKSGATFDVEMTLQSSEDINSVTPSNITFNGSNGATATCSSPTPSSLNIVANTPSIVTYACSVTAGSSPGVIAFNAQAVDGNNDVVFEEGTSLGIIVYPQLSFDVVVDGQIDSSTLFVENTATVESNEQSATGDSIFIETERSDLEITNSVNNTTPSTNDQITYTITISNTGPDPVSDIQVTELLPNGLVYDSDNSGATGTTYDVNTGIWDLGSTVLSNGDSSTLEILVTVDGSVLTITNTSSITNQSIPDIDYSNNSDSSSIVVDPLDLVLTTSVVGNPASVSPGSVVRYRIDLANIGPSDGTGIQVTDNLPAGTSINDGSSITSQGTFDETTGVWDVGSLADSSSAVLEFDITVPIENGTLTNSATISSVDQGEMDMSNNTSSITTPISPFVDLTVSKDSEFDFVPLDPGDPEYTGLATFFVYASNYGTIPATNVVVNDPIGGIPVPFVSASPTQGAYDQNTGIWNIGTLGANQTAILVLNFDVTSGTNGSVLSNSATISGNELDLFPANNSDSAQSTLFDPIVLSLTKEIVSVDDNNSNSLNDEGDVVTYEYTATNIGNAIAYDIAIDEIAFTGANGMLTPAVISGGLDLDNEGDLPDLALGGTITWSAPYSIIQSDVDRGELLNQVRSRSFNALSNTISFEFSDDPNDATNVDIDSDGDPDDVTTIELGAPATVQLEKTAQFNDENNDGFAQVGETVNYSFTVINNGTKTLQNIAITDSLVSVSGASLGTLSPGDSDSSTFSATYTITQPDIDSGTLQNSAIVTAQDIPGNAVSDISDDPNENTNIDNEGDGEPDDPTIIALPTNSEIELIKTSSFNDTNGDGIAQAGETISYSFTITNIGNTTLSNIDVSDVIAPVAGGPIPALAPGDTDSTTFSATYTITATDRDNGFVDNLATVTSTDPFSVTINDDDSDIYYFSTEDADNDGIPDQFDIDDDNDGIIDLNEKLCSPNTIPINTPNFPLNTNFNTSNTASGTIQDIIQSGDLTIDFDYELVGSATWNGGVEIQNFPAINPDGDVLYLQANNTGVNSGNHALYTFNFSKSVSDFEIFFAGLDVLDTLVVTATNNGVPVNVAFQNVNIPPGDLTFTPTQITSSASAPPQQNPSFGVVKITLTREIDTLQFVSGKLNQTGSNNTIFMHQIKYCEALDEDEDGIQDSIDIDADNDGIPDNIEIQPTNGYIFPSGIDADNDGLDDAYDADPNNPDPIVSAGITPEDTDNDGIPDYLDLDSDNEGGDDTTEAGYVFNGSLADSDSDGLLDSFDVIPGAGNNGSPSNVTNGITEPVTQLPDTDGDALTDDVDYRDDTFDDITLFKTGVFNDENNDGLAQPGETISYSFTVENTGNTTLNTITLTDSIATVSGGPIPNLLPGQSDSTTFVAVYTITQPDLDVGSVTNTATVTGLNTQNAPITDDSDDPTDPTDLDPDGDGDPEDPTVIPLPADSRISLIKNGQFNDENNDGLAQVGETISYTFEVTNTGSTTLTNITLSDSIASVSGGPIVSLAPGASDSSTFTATYGITQTDIDNGFVENTASVQGTDPFSNNVSDISDDPLDSTNVDPNGDGEPDDPTIELLPFDSSLSLEKVGVFNDLNNNSISQVGETISYTFTVTNTGTTTLSNITLTDTIASINGGPIASLAPGETDSTTFTASYTLTQPDIDGGEVVNTATVFGEDPSSDIIADDSDDPANLTDVDPNGDGEPDDPTVVELSVPSSLSLTKVSTFEDEVSNGVAQVGETISYTFTVTNTGITTLTNVTLTDSIATVSGGPIPSLAPGATDSSTFTASYTITQADLNNGFVENTATVSALNPANEIISDDSDDPINLTDVDPNGDGEPDDPTVEILPYISKITLEKESNFEDENNNGIAEPGETITYTFAVTNIGTTTLSNVTLSDTIATVIGGPIPSLVPGATDTSSFTAVYTITQPDIDAGQVINTATTTATDPFGDTIFDDSDDPNDLADIDPNGDNEPDDPTVQTLPYLSSVSLEKSGVFNDENNDSLPQVGETISYTFEIANTGVTTLSNLTITDPLLTVAGGPLTTLAPGAVDSGTFSGTYSLTQSDIDLGLVINTATVTGTDPFNDPVSDDSDDPINTTDIDPNGDGEPDDPTVVLIGDEGSIGLEKISNFNDENNDGLAQPGETISYIFIVTNLGTNTLSNIEVSDPVISVSGSPIASLSGGASDSTTFSGTYTLNQIDIDAGFIENTATVMSRNPQNIPITDISDDPSNTTDVDPNNDGNPDDPTVELLPYASTVSLEKVSVFNDESGDGLAQPGETVSYTFAVTNTGSTTLSNLTLTDSTATVNGGSIPSLAPGDTDSTTFTAEYTITQSDIDSGEIQNIATVTGVDPFNDPVTDDSDDPNDLTDIDPNGDGEPDDPTLQDLPYQSSLSLEKMSSFNDESSDGLAQPGETINYTFSVTNTGTTTITNISLTDSITSVNGGPIPSLVPGANDSSSFTATYTITQSDIDNGLVINTATVTGSDPFNDPVSDDSDDPNNLTNIDPNGDGEPDDPTIEVLPNQSSISLTKISTFEDENNDSIAQVGETISYDFTVINTGTTTLTDVTLFDTIATVFGGPIPSLSPGGTDATTFTAIYTITQSDIDAGLVENTATISGLDFSNTAVTDDSDDPNDLTDTDPNGDGEPDDPTIQLLPYVSSLSLEKVSTFEDESGDGIAQPGETISYTFSITNTGVTTLNAISPIDPVVNLNGSPISTLVPGDTDTSTYTATYTITQTDIDTGLVENIATASGIDPFNDPITDDSDDPTDLTNTDLNGDGEPDDPTIQTLPYVSTISLEKVGSFNDENNDGLTQPGETISYTFSVTNTGTTTLSNIIINDPLATVFGGPVVTLGPGATDATTFTATYAVTQADIDNAEVVNTATVTGTDPQNETITDISDDPNNLTNDDPNGDGEPDDPTVVVIGDIGTIELEKSSIFNDENNDSVAQPGETISYTFQVTNTGTTTLSNITLTDIIATISGGPIATLAPGSVDSSTFTALYSITQADIDAGFVENSATVDSTNPQNITVSDISDDPDFSVNVDLEGDGEPDDPTIELLPYTSSLSLEKVSTFEDESGDGIAQIGETISYDFVVTNTGTTTLSNITVTDTIASVFGGPILSLAPGGTDSTTFTASYTITQTDIDNGEVENIANANGVDPQNDPVTDDSDDPTNLTDIDPNGDGEPDDPTVQPIPTESNISLQKVGVFNDENNDGVAQIGETIGYSFVVTNTGTTTLSNILLSDSIASVSGGPIATLAPGNSDTSTFTATYTITQLDIDNGEVENTATATGEDPLNNTVTDDSDDPNDLTDTDPNGDGEPDDPTITSLPFESLLSLEKVGVFNDESGDGIAQVGETIGYTFSITNTGTTTLTDISLTDTIATVFGGPIPSLAPGATDPGTFTASYTITQVDIDNGLVQNTATANGLDLFNNPVTDDSDDPTNLTNNDPNGDGEPDDPTITLLPYISTTSLQKVATFNDESGDGLAQVGETIGYTFSVTNTGTTTLFNVELIDSIATVSGGPIPTLTQGATDSSTFTATYTITQSDIDTGLVQNTATVNATDPFNDPVTDDSDDPIDLTDTDPNGDGEPDDPTIQTLPYTSSVSLEKVGVFNDESGDGITQPGETISYTFEVTNTGTTTISNITLTDTIASVSGGPVPLLDPGATDSTTFLATYTITQADIDAGEVENIATANGVDPFNDPVTDDSDDPADLTDSDSNGDGEPDDPTVVILGDIGKIQLEKTSVFNDESGDGVAQPGETISYDFVVTNTGTTTLSNVVITDPLVTMSGSPITILSPGDSDTNTYNASYTITQADIDAGLVENSATVTAVNQQNAPVTDISDDPTDSTNIDTEGDGEPDDPTVELLPYTSSLSLQKISSFEDENNDGFAQPGETVSYDFEITNTGTTTLSNITITDTIAQVSGSPISSLAPGDSDNVTYTAVYTLAQADIDAGEVENIATANGVDPFNDPVTDDSDDPNNVTDIDPNGDGEPDDPTLQDLPYLSSLSLEKVSSFEDENNDGLAQVGETISYTFSVSNTGTTTLSNINLIDTIATVVGGPISTLAPGQIDASTFVAIYTITQADIDAGQIENTATVSGTDPFNDPVTDDSDDPNDLTDTDPNGDGEPDDPTIQTLPSESTISLQKVGVLNDENNDSVTQPGETISYSFVVTNTGLTTLSNITIIDTIANVSGGPISSLAPSASDTATFTALYTITQADIDAGLVENIATVTGSDPFNNPVTDDSDDPNDLTDNDSNSDGEPDDPTVLLLPYISSISLEKVSTFEDESGDGLAQPGETVSYDFAVTNTGTTTLRDITISDTIAAVSGGPITTLNPGDTDSATFTATYTITQVDIDAGLIENTAIAEGVDPQNDSVFDTSDDPNDLTDIDPNGDNEPDDPTIQTLPYTSSISLEKSSVINDQNNDGLAQPGETIEYSFTVTNTGTTTLTNITLIDTLVSVNGGPITTLNPGDTDSATFTATYTITQADIDAGSITNTATANGTDPFNDLVTDDSDDPNDLADNDPNGDGEPDDPTVVSLPTESSINLEKIGVFNDQSNNGIAGPGETISYFFTVTNTGNTTLSNISLTDSLVTVLGGPIPTLLPGDTDSSTFTATLIVSQGDIDTGEVINTAIVTATDPFNDPVTDDSDDPTDLTDSDSNGDGEPDDPTVVPLPNGSEISLLKEGTFNDDNNDGIAQPGETISYIFAVFNTGNTTLTDITLTDTIATVSGGPITTMLPGDIDLSTFTATYTITQSDIDTGVVENIATVEGQDPTGDPVTDDSDDPNDITDIDPNGDGEPDDPTDVVLPYISSISLEKDGEFNDQNNDGLAQVGETITYTFSVTNTGTTTLSNIAISDTLVSVVGGPLATLDPGQTDSLTYSAEYTLTQSDIDAGFVENSAIVEAVDSQNDTVTDDSDDPEDLADNDPNGDGEPDDPTIEILPYLSQVSLEKESVLNDQNNDGLSQPGETITYTFAITNTGNTTVSTISITDSLVTVDGGPVATLLPGDSDTTTFTAEYTLTQADIDAGFVENTATANGTDPFNDPVTDDSDDPNELTDIDPNGDGEPDDPTIEIVPYVSSLSLEKDGEFNDQNNDGLAQPGETISYTFSVTNTGTTTLSNITVTDPLVSVLGGPIPSLIPGAIDTTTFTAEYTITQVDIDAGEIDNSAFATGTDPQNDPVTDESDDPNDLTEVDPDGDGEPDDPTVIELPADSSLSLLKEAVFVDENNDGIAQPGETVSYIFGVINTGTTTISDITIDDPMVTVLGGPIPSLSPGGLDLGTYTAVYTISQADIDAGLVENTATVEGFDLINTVIVDISDDPTVITDLDTEGDGEPDDPTVVLLPYTSSLSLEKVSNFEDENNDGITQVGESINYTFAVTNTGTTTLSNITVTDTIASVLGGPIPNLAPGETNSTAFTAEYTITQADIDAGFVENTATANGTNPFYDPVTDDSDDPNDLTDIDPNGDGEPDDPTIEILPYISSIEVEKAGIFNDLDNNGFADVGETISYTFSVTNTGVTTLSNITLIDPLVTVSGGPIPTLLPLELDQNTFTAEYVLTQNDLDNELVENVATVSAIDPQNDTIEDLSDDALNTDDEDDEGDGEPDDPTIVSLIVNTNTTFAKADINQTPQDTPVDGSILTNDYDFEGDSQTVIQITGLNEFGNTINIPLDGTPTIIYNDTGQLAGTIAITDNGIYEFVPETGFLGEVELQYEIVDNNANPATDTTTLTIEVFTFNDPIENDPPIANNDAKATLEDTNVSGNVLDNDSDPENDTLTVIGIVGDTDGDGNNNETVAVGTSQQVYGTNIEGDIVIAGELTINNDGTYIFDPEPGFTGTVEIDYTIEDEESLTDTAELFITVLPIIGNITFANDDAQTGSSGEVLTGNVLDNDFDPENNTLAVNSAIEISGNLVTIGTPTTLDSGGDFTLNGDGTYSYNPADTFVGTEVVNYTQCDNNNPQACDEATLYLTITRFLVPDITLDKTLYEGTDNGARCETDGVNRLVLVDAVQSLRSIVYCFDVTNTGETYLGQLELDDQILGITEVDMTIAQGSVPLAPGESATYTYTTLTNTSINNTATVTGYVTNQNGDIQNINCNLVPFDQQPSTTCPVSSTDEDAVLIYVFDPPFGIKIGQYQGNSIIRWTQVWINDATEAANNVIIGDEPPVGMSYAGNLDCEGLGASVVLTCEFLEPSTQFPRGFVRVTANIEPDPGGTSLEDTNNAVTIAFDSLALAPLNGQTYENQSFLEYDPDEDGIPDFIIGTYDPTTVDNDEITRVTVPVLQIVRTGGQAMLVPIGIILIVIAILLSTWKKDDTEQEFAGLSKPNKPTRRQSPKGSQAIQVSGIKPSKMVQSVTRTLEKWRTHNLKHRDKIKLYDSKEYYFDDFDQSTLTPSTKDKPQSLKKKKPSPKKTSKQQKPAKTTRTNSSKKVTKKSKKTKKSTSTSKKHKKKPKK
jgi:uncharacterized repeat protein (TIGR01451 family)